MSIGFDGVPEWAILLKKALEKEAEQMMDAEDEQ